MDVSEEATKFASFLISRNWPTNAERAARVHIIDRYRLRRPVAQEAGSLVPTDWIGFCDLYCIVTLPENFGEPDSWRDSRCTCKRHTSCGTCQHTIGIFQVFGGQLTGDQCFFQHVKGISKTRRPKPKTYTEKIPQLLRIGDLKPISAFFQNARDARVRRSEREEEQGSADVMLTDFWEDPMISDAEIEILSQHGSEEEAEESQESEREAEGSHRSEGEDDGSHRILEGTRTELNSPEIPGPRPSRPQRNVPRINYAAFR